MVSAGVPSGFIFSQSSLQDYSDCPKRFSLRYIEKLQWPAVESEPALETERRQQEGKLFHKMVQQQLLGIPADKLRQEAATPNLRRWWENYTAHPLDLSGYTQYIELSLSAPIASYFRLTAKYDLVAVHEDGSVLIYDWKTYANRPRDETMIARWQTRVYRAMLILAGMHLNKATPIKPEHVKMTYWYSDHPTEPACFPYTATQFRRDKDALNRLAGEISTASDFPKTDEEKKCAFCVYRSYCERKIEIGSGDDLLETEYAEPEITLEQIQEIAF